MSDYIKKEIGPGIEMLCVKADRFKTNEIAISLATPLREETASVNALLVSLLCRSSKKYRDMTALNKKLFMLYGASLSSDVQKVGECQVLRMGITCLDDRFALDDRAISAECLELLLSLLFEPNLDENESFFDEDIETEKRLLKEKIEAEENEKRIYVLRRTEAEMFKNEPYGTDRFGTREAIKSITKDMVKNAWQTLLGESKILVTMIGSANSVAAEALLSQKFVKISRSFSPLPASVFIGKANRVSTHEERINVKQGKLVLGFRVDLKSEDKRTTAMRSFCDVFGGGPYSRLFTNVREKMSLCYYCSARYTRLKSCIFVQCGCEEENMNKAVEEIQNQLEEIKKGDFDEAFLSSKIGLADAILSVKDTPAGIESWYCSQITDELIKSPEESVKENNAVTKENIIECANLLTLDTVFKLESNGEDAQ